MAGRKAKDATKTEYGMPKQMVHPLIIASGKYEETPTVTINESEFKKLLSHRKNSEHIIEKQAEIIENLYKDVEGYVEYIKRSIKIADQHRQDTTNTLRAIRYRFPHLYFEILTDHTDIDEKL